MRLVKDVPGLATAVAQLQSFADDAQRLGRQHMVERDVAQLEYHVFREYEIDRIAARRVVLPTMPHLGSLENDQAEGLIMVRAPLGVDGRCALLVVSGQCADARGDFQMNVRSVRIGGRPRGGSEQG